MISVIVCSRNQELAGNLSANIEKTIGVPFETIVYDNSQERLGIAAVYNKAAANAKYPILCFVHEDVIFRTDDWGKKIGLHFREENTGVIGIAGGDAMSRVPASWSNVFFSKSMHLIQHLRNSHQTSYLKIPENELHPKKKVLTIDGVFMCVRKSVFSLYPFDENLLKGFHGYDQDYSFQLSIRFRNYVIYDVLLEHMSEGQPDRDWFESTRRVAHKWKRRLPASVCQLEDQQWQAYHWQSLHVMINRMYELKYHPVRIYLYSIAHSMNRHMNLKRFLSMNRLFFKRLFNPGKPAQI